MDSDYIVDLLTREALKRCEEKRQAMVSRKLMQYMIEKMYSARSQDLLYAENNKEEADKIYEWIYEKVSERSPLVQMLRLCHYFHNAETEFDKVQAKYEKITKDKLNALLERICSTNSVTKTDQDDLFRKIVIYLVASHKLFSTKNLQMMSEAKCALHSIISPEDLLDFVSRKKHYRLSYLERMGKIMCGILLYNKQTGMGGEAIRDVLSDIAVGYKNTLESLENQLAKCKKYVMIGIASVTRSVVLDLSNSIKIYQIPESMTVDQLKYFNTFNYLHMEHENYLHQLLNPINKLNDMIEQYSNEMKEAYFRLNDVIKFRLAIPTELVFPHFITLFETWYKILMKLYYLVEINRINDDMADIVSSDYPFDAVAALLCKRKNLKTVEVPFEMSVKRSTSLSLIKRKDIESKTRLSKFCGLTLAITGGILTYADQSVGLLPIQDQFLALKNKQYAKFAQTHYTSVGNYFINAARRNPEISLLFKISAPGYVKGKDLGIRVSLTKKKITSVGNQTDHHIPPPTIEEKNMYSWNCWDYRRRAITLANLRNSQTHSAQTYITYSSKDASIQTYDLRTSTHRGICSSSQVSKSVCHILDETEKVYPLKCQIEECPPEVVEEDEDDEDA